MPIKAVLFDMDGVLFDSEPYHDSMNLVLLRSLGIDADASVTSPYIGRASTTLWTSMKEMFSLEPTVAELDDMIWKLKVGNLSKSGLRPSRGLGALLAYLEEQSIPFTLASSSRRAFIEAAIDYLDIGGRISGYTCVDEVIHGKPAPDIFLLAAKKLGAGPDECLVVEDSTAGVAAGKAAGMFTVGYDNPTSAGQDVTPADRSVTDLADVREIIESFRQP